jgi:NAD(P) transhydrogenase alpha subunit
MDALTSMAGVSGYRAVVEAAGAFGRFFNGQITAAGKVPPAKVFIAGAGVAGLAAIGAAASLGAIVRANDTRAEVADQVVSLGGEFVKVNYEEEGSGGGGYAKVMSEGFQAAQREMYAQQTKECDIIITTALIPGKPAPKLITAEMVRNMKPGSVIVDMAAEQGGNCELTEPGKAVVKHGVTIVGYTDLASRMARQSSTLYGTNLFRLTEELCKTKDGVINVNMEDDAIRGLTVIKEGAITWPAPPLVVAAKPAPKPAAAPAAKKGHGHGEPSGPMPAGQLAIVAGVAAVLFVLVGAYAPAAFLSHFTVFVLACFVGYMVVWNVKPALHTPLMSVTNAISSIIAIGALVQISPMANAAAAPQHAHHCVGLSCPGAHRHQHVWRLCSHSAHAGDVQKIIRKNSFMSSNLSTVAYIGATILFILSSGRIVQPGNRTPWQPLRHGRHDLGRFGHRPWPPSHSRRHALDCGQLGRWRCHRLVRSTLSANDANARVGGAHAQHGRHGCSVGRLCHLRRSRSNQRL